MLIKVQIDAYEALTEIDLDEIIIYLINRCEPRGDSRCVTEVINEVLKVLEGTER